MMKYFVCGLIFFILLANRSSADSEFELLILHNNDLHGQFTEVNAKGGMCSANSVKINNCFGGFARISQLVKNIRAAEHKKTVLFLNAGDSFTGSALFSIFRENITSEFLNQLSIDAMCLGNHEFDQGVQTLQRFINMLQFPVVTANMDLRNAPELQHLKNLYNSIILEKNGRQIGIIGYVTPETKFKNVQTTVDFYEEVERINIEAEILKAQGINIIIALGHSGFPVDINIAMNCPDVDVVIGGHTNTFLYNGPPPDIDIPVGSYPHIVKHASGKLVPVIQAYAYSKYLGMLNLTFDENGDLTNFTGQPILLDHSYSQDPEVLMLLQKYQQKVQELDKQIIGRTFTVLDGNSCRLQECNFGNLIVDSMMWYYIRTQFNETEYWTDASIAFINSGAIRSSIDVLDRNGVLSVFNIYSVLPFENRLVVATVTGCDILDILENSVAHYSVYAPNGGFLQMFGVQVVYNLSQPINHRVVSANLLCAKCRIPTYMPLVKDEVYKIIITDFLMSGGDQFPIPQIRTITNLSHISSVIEYIRSRNLIIPKVENRITLHGEIDE